MVRSSWGGQLNYIVLLDLKGLDYSNHIYFNAKCWFYKILIDKIYVVWGRCIAMGSNNIWIFVSKVREIKNKKSR